MPLTTEALAAPCKLENRGIATAATMPSIAITTINSTKVNPLIRFKLDTFFRKLFTVQLIIAKKRFVEHANDNWCINLTKNMFAC